MLIMAYMFLSEMYILIFKICVDVSAFLIYVGCVGLSLIVAISCLSLVGTIIPYVLPQDSRY